jgi:hypothetical protein
MTRQIYRAPEVRKKTAAEEVRANIFTAVLAVVIYYVIVCTLKALFSPLRYLFASSKELYAEDEQKALEKVHNRKVKRGYHTTDEDSMLNQYIERFQKNPLKYAKDASNVLYKEWYEAYQNGTLLDSILEWAPEVYVEDENYDRSPNPEFLFYLGRQVDLHNHAGFRDRHVFLKTIGDFYPEFTAKLSVIPSEIDEMREEITAKDLKNELVSEITTKGVGQKFVESILKQDLPHQLKKNILLARKCSENNYCVAMFQYCVATGFEPDEGDLSMAVNGILENIKVEELATVLIKGTLSQEEVLEIMEMSRKLASKNEGVLDRTEMAKYLLDKKLRERITKGALVC